MEFAHSRRRVVFKPQLGLGFHVLVVTGHADDVILVSDITVFAVEICHRVFRRYFVFPKTDDTARCFILVILHRTGSSEDLVLVISTTRLARSRYRREDFGPAILTSTRAPFLFVEDPTTGRFDYPRNHMTTLVQRFDTDTVTEEDHIRGAG